MNIIEIPSEQRSLGYCRGCKGKHYCDWQIEGQYYCGNCKEKMVEPEVKESLPVDIFTAIDNENDFPVSIAKTKPNSFTLTPTSIINLSIGTLANGIVVNNEGKTEVFPTWEHFMVYMERLNNANN